MSLNSIFIIRSVRSKIRKIVMDEDEKNDRVEYSKWKRNTLWKIDTKLIYLSSIYTFNLPLLITKSGIKFHAK